MARNWSDREIAAVVAAYFRMLDTELEGRRYNKSQANRKLREQIDRTGGSVEFKHANISAVLSSHGLPYINGYKPRRHFQVALYEAVEDRLRADRKLHERLAGANLTADQRVPGSPTHPPPLIEYAPPPPVSPPRETKEEIRRVIRRFGHPAERDARNRSLGRAGEAYVLAAEQERLRSLGLDDLAGQVRWVADLDGDGFGYDIRSFVGAGDRPDQERWLEVKTTTGPMSTPLFITRKELEVSREHACPFRLVRLFDFQRRKAAFRLAPPLEKQVRLDPLVYRASF